MMTRLGFVVGIFIVLQRFIDASKDDHSSSNHDVLMRMACSKNPSLIFCQSKRETVTRTPASNEAVESVESRARIAQRLRNNSHQTNSRRLPTSKEEGFVRQEGKEEVLTGKTSTQGPTDKEQAFVDGLRGIDPVELQNKCSQVGPIAVKTCRRENINKSNIHQCAAYFRDCARFFTKTDPLYGIANAFNSGVGLNLGTFSVNGIPYYPINEEGGIGAGRIANVPFGSWGGGYSENIGVRYGLITTTSYCRFSDYWSQFQEAGANWYDGKYGYRNGWTVPLVQSLGVEGGQHNVVSVPLRGDKFGAIDVDNGYGVGPYYQQNLHNGVNWKKGEVINNFGVGAPLVGTGVSLGTAVVFPSLDTFQPALGK